MDKIEIDVKIINYAYTNVAQL